MRFEDRARSNTSTEDLGTFSYVLYNILALCVAMSLMNTHITKVEVVKKIKNISIFLKRLSFLFTRH